MLKQKTLLLIGLVLIAVPLIGCYTGLRILNLSANITAIFTVCLSGIIYLLLVTRIEPLLGRMLPFLNPKHRQNLLRQNWNLVMLIPKRHKVPVHFP